MLLRSFAALALLLVTSAAWAGGQGHFADTVDNYRKMIILANGATALESPGKKHDQAVAAARYYYSEEQTQIRAILDAARQQVPLTPSNRLTETTSDFVDFVTNKPDHMRDGDLLAFMDLAQELLDMERFRLGEGPRLAPIRAANDRIQGVLKDYREEYSRAMSEITRGKRARESWDDYIAAISVEHSFAQLMQQAADKKMVVSLAKLAQQRREEAGKQFTHVLGAPEVVWGGGLPKKTVVLSFDDGPSRTRTNKILDILDQYSANAYFFSLGEHLGSIDAKGKPHLGRTASTARRILDEGDVLANHSFSHTAFSKLSADKRAKEIGDTNKLIAAIGGKKAKLFRPPYGDKDDALEAMTAKRGMASVMWNVDSMDWADPVPESIIDRTIRQVEKHKRGILLFHDIHSQTVKALPGILDALAERGYRVVALDGKPFNSKTGGKLTPPKRDHHLYSQSWAVVIGINQYQHWPKLQYAVNDAKAVADMLTDKLGFAKDHVIRLFDDDATRENIVNTLGYRMADPRRIGKDDRVFVFYSGHGMTRPLPDGSNLGYIIPVDADTQRYQTRSISMSELHDFSAEIPAKHVFFVMDSCYSGLALTRAGVTVGQTRNYLKHIAERRARQILTAGGANEQVADGGPGGHSIFTWTLLQGLMGLADTDSNGYVSASELGTYLAPVVSSYSDQTPVFGNLVGSKGGDFVFKVQEAALKQVNEQLTRDDERVKQELDALRQDTQSRVKRRLELQVALAKGEQIDTPKPDKTTQPGADRIREANKHDAKALHYFRKGKYEAARKEWKEAVHLNPYDPNIVNNYGYVLDTLGEYDKALKWYYRTVELQPRRTPIYLNLGDIMVKMGRKKDAIQYYERYLHLYPSYEKADELRKKIKAYSEL